MPYRPPLAWETEAKKELIEKQKRDPWEEALARSVTSGIGGLAQYGVKKYTEPYFSQWASEKEGTPEWFQKKQLGLAEAAEERAAQAHRQRTAEAGAKGFEYGPEAMAYFQGEDDFTPDIPQVGLLEPGLLAGVQEQVRVQPPPSIVPKMQKVDPARVSETMKKRTAQQKTEKKTALKEERKHQIHKAGVGARVRKQALKERQEEEHTFQDAQRMAKDAAKRTEEEKKLKLQGVVGKMSPDDAEKYLRLSAYYDKLELMGIPKTVTIDGDETKVTRYDATAIARAMRRIKNDMNNLELRYKGKANQSRPNSREVALRKLHEKVENVAKMFAF